MCPAVFFYFSVKFCDMTADFCDQTPCWNFQEFEEAVAETLHDISEVVFFLLGALTVTWRHHLKREGNVYGKVFQKKISPIFFFGPLENLVLKVGMKTNRRFFSMIDPNELRHPFEHPTIKKQHRKSSNKKFDSKCSSKNNKSYSFTVPKTSIASENKPS